MRRRAPFLGLVLSVLLVPAAADAAPEIRVEMYSYSIQGLEWPAGSPVETTVRDRTGRIKGYDQGIVGASGTWNCSFSENVRFLPGDELTVKIGAQPAYQHTLSRIAITRVNPKRNLLGVRVSPPRTTLGYQVVRDVLTPGGWVSQDIRHLETSADGTFLFDTTPVLDLMRLDFMALGYQEGVFNVYRLNRVPGVTVYIGSPYVEVVGMVGQPYQISLLGSGGSVKGRAPALIGDDWFRSDEVAFRQASGAPIPILPGDRLVVDGPYGFRATVPAMDVAADPPSMITGNAPPGSTVAVRVNLYNGGTYQKALTCVTTADSGTGHFGCAWPGETIDPGDILRVESEDAAGNYFNLSERVRN